MKSILWCTSHYKQSFIQEKIKEIREKIKASHEDFKDYKSASIVDKLMDYDKDGNLVQYNRIRLYKK